jgi:predicted permease
MVRDIGFGVKRLLKDRAYTTTALLTLAVCIGANTAIFTIVHSVLLKPLPVPNSERILLMSNQYPKMRSGPPSTHSAVPDYYDRLRDMNVYEDQAMYDGANLTFDVQGTPTLIHGMTGTPSLLRLAKVPPIQGRIFDESEGEIGRDREIVLSYGLWQQLYAGNPGVIGQQFRIGGGQRTIVGVMPQGFQFIDPEAQFWVPLGFTPEQKSDDYRHHNSLVNIGRLKPGATIEQARQQVNSVNTANLDRFPQFKQLLVDAGFYTQVDRFQDVLVRDVRSTLYFIWGGAAFVLLIGALNIANLALARSSLRIKELSTRLAIGASRTQIGRQLIVESLLLSLTGGVAGIFTGWAILRALAAIGIERLPRANEIQIDLAVIAAVLAVSAIAGVMIGLVPVLSLVKLDLSTALHEESRTGTAGHKARALRRALVIAEVAFAFILLGGSGLLVASFRNLLAVDPGFKPDGVITAGIWIPGKDDAAARSFTNRLLQNIRTIPGVQNAGATTNLPLSGFQNNDVVIAEGYQPQPGEPLVSPHRTVVTPGYFEAMGMTLLRGRYFDEHDNDSAPGAVLIDDKLAQRFWPGADPIGKRIYEPDKPDDLVNHEHTKWLTVAGVVREARVDDLASGSSAGAYYYAAAQEVPRNLILAIKTPTSPAAVLPAVRAKIKELDPQLILVNERTMNDYTAISLMPRRTAMLLATSFAIVSLFLAAIGIYGVLAFIVTQRFREIGIRIALGSTPLGIFALMLREGIQLAGGGLILGFAGIAALQQIFQNQIYGLEATDPFVMGTVATILAVIAVAACSLPARRATQIDPVAVLNRQ